MNQPTQCILVAEDQPKMAEIVGNALNEAGFKALLVHNGNDALANLAAGGYSALVLDVVLPGCDGLSVVRQIRNRGDRIPVLLISGRSAVDEKVEGLNAGADDYLAKPFAIAELLARIRALVRTRERPRDLVLRVGDLSLDTSTRIARRGERKIELTNREFHTLEYLMRAAGRICPRMMIIEAVWESRSEPASNVLDGYIRRLREKIEQDGEAKLLHNERGVGFMIKAP